MSTHKTASRDAMFPILLPDKVPFGDIVTDTRCNYGLPPGQHALRQNVRIDGRQCRVRPGITQVIAAPASGNLVDLWGGELNGTSYLVGIFNITGANRVYFTTDFATWTEATATAGHDGSTRLATYTNKYQTFCAVKVPRFAYWGNYSGTTIVSRDVLLINTGGDYPLVFDPGTDIDTIGSTTKTYCFFQRDLSTPNSFGLNGSMATFSKFYQVRTSANKTTGGAATTYPAVAGPPAVNNARYILGNSAAGAYTVGNTNVVAAFAKTGNTSGDIAAWHIDLSDNDYSGGGLYFVVECNTSVADLNTMLANSAIEVGGVSTHTTTYANVTDWQMIYDPTSTDPALANAVTRPTVDLDPSNKRFVFWINTPFTGCNWIRFTNRAVNATNFSLYILNVCILGYCPGGTSFGVSNENYFAFTESPGVVCPALAPEKLNNLGGPTLVNLGASTTSPPSIVEDVKCNYLYNILLWNPYYGTATTTGSLGTLPTGYCIYAKLAGQQQHYFAGRYTLATPTTSGGSAAWTSTNSSRSTVTATIGDGFSQPLVDLLPNRELPSAYNYVTPRGRANYFANGRLFVGNLTTTSVGDVSVSGAWPFRFQDIPIGQSGQNEAQLGCTVNVGPNSVQSFVSTGANFEGASNVYCLTTDAVYKIGLPLGSALAAGINSGGGSIGVFQQPVKVGFYGTNSPKSVIEDRGIAYWLDRNAKFIRMTNEGVEDISYMNVGDRFRDIPATYVTKVTSSFLGDRIYIGYTPTGATTHTKMLVRNTRMDIWESEDAPGHSSIAYDYLVRVRDTSKTGTGYRLFAGTASGGTVWEIDNGSNDNGNAPTVTLTTGEIPTPFQGWVLADQVFLESDKQSGSSFTVSRTYYPSGQSAPSTTLSLVDASNASWPRVSSYDSFQGSGSNARSGKSVIVSLSGSIPCGTVLRECNVRLIETSSALGRR